MEEGTQPQPQHMVNLEVEGGGEVPAVASGTNLKKAKGAAKAKK